MRLPTNKDWQDLPKPLNLFTARNAEKIDLKTGEKLMYYTSGTKIVVTQKCNLPGKTYYRTAEAAQKGVNHVFEATAFGLPNELAPLAPAISPRQEGSAPPLAEKQTENGYVSLPESGEARRRHGLLRRLFRRQDG